MPLSALPEFLNELRPRVAGELRTDAYSQVLYSTDASIYRVPPLGVLIPETFEDVQAAVEIAAKHHIPVLPRGAGSSLAGQAVNAALVIDMTRHLDQVLEINPEERWVRVQPGLVLDELNLRLAPLGLQFGPDPASSNRATLGGIVSNNSTGSHSIVYGMTADHVLSTDVLLSDGSPTNFSPLTEDAFNAKRQGKGLEGDIYRAMHTLRTDGADVIRAGTPRHWRRCGGYNLDRLIPAISVPNGGTIPSFKIGAPGQFNLASLVCGAEGTLAVIREIKLNLVPVPEKSALAVVHFASLSDALSSVPEILETGPSAIELLDHIGLTRSKAVPAYARLLNTFIDGDPNCVLVTEYTGESDAELKARMDRLRRKSVGSSIVELFSPEAQARVWQVRKVALGFLMSVKGDFKPVPFIEDAAVPVEHLADYISQIEGFCETIGTKVGYYAHASAGCLHVRPLINTKTAREIAKMPSILDFSVALLGEYGGALSSEHGDGRARSWINERFFGPALYDLFRKTKAAFDPHNLLNPGNIVDAPHMTENLRYGPDYHTIPLGEHLDFSEDHGFAGAVEMCNGAGICRKRTAGTMCPSFMVTRDEEHSTRGRANALRAALSGVLPTGELTSRRMYEVMDLCIECKACKAECPSGVDMAKIKFEFLAQYYENNRVPLRSRIFAGIAGTSRLVSGPLAPIVNSLLRLPPVRWGLDRFFGITSRRGMPAFARSAFSQQVDRLPRGSNSRPQLVLFADTVNNFNEPDVLHAAYELLDAAGFDVLVHSKSCCGRPMISKGLHAMAVAAARETLDALHPFAARGLPILGLEPSCLSAMKDDYLFLLPDDLRAAELAAAVMPVEEFIVRLADEGRLSLVFEQKDEEILFHGHCHQKAIFGTAATRQALALTGARVAEVDSGCCGMAGSFGYESEHYDVSQAMGERKLFPAMRAHAGTVAAPGVSCRAQIAHGTGRQARHPIQILRDAVRRTHLN